MLCNFGSQHIRQVPAHGNGVGAGWSLRLLPTQTILNSCLAVLSLQGGICGKRSGRGFPRIKDLSLISNPHWLILKAFPGITWGLESLTCCDIAACKDTCSGGSCISAAAASAGQGFAFWPFCKSLCSAKLSCSSSQGTHEL